MPSIKYYLIRANSTLFILFAAATITVTGSSVFATAAAYSPAITETCSETVENSESIQEAIDSATSGDVICIESGAFEEDLEIGTPNLTLRAADDDAAPVIEGGNTGIRITDTGNPKIFYQNVCYIFGQKSRQCRTQVNIFHAQVQ